MSDDAIEYTSRDARDLGAGPAVLCHVCNDIGLFGAGFAAAVAERWPWVRDSFLAWARGDVGAAHGKPYALGSVQFRPLNDNHTQLICNMVAQRGVVSRKNKVPLSLPHLRECLAQAALTARALKGPLVMPRIGCGLAGGTWEVVEPAVRAACLAAGVKAIVCDLPGPPKQRVVN